MRSIRYCGYWLALKLFRKKDKGHGEVPVETEAEADITQELLIAKEVQRVISERGLMSKDDIKQYLDDIKKDERNE